MKSLPIEPVIAIYQRPPPNGARFAYGVRSRKLANGATTSYTVTGYDVALTSGKRALRLTCDCRGARFGHLCRHAKAVIKRRMPTASIWAEEAHAIRQKRRRYPVLYGTNNGRGGICYVTERRPQGKRIRGIVR